MADYQKVKVISKTTASRRLEDGSTKVVDAFIVELIDPDPVTMKVDKVSEGMRSQLEAAVGSGIFLPCRKGNYEGATWFSPVEGEIMPFSLPKK